MGVFRAKTAFFGVFGVKTAIFGVFRGGRGGVKRGFLGGKPELGPYSPAEKGGKKPQKKGQKWAVFASRTPPSDPPLPPHFPRTRPKMDLFWHFLGQNEPHQNAFTPQKTEYGPSADKKTRSAKTKGLTFQRTPPKTPGFDVFFCCRLYRPSSQRKDSTFFGAIPYILSYF